MYECVRCVCLCVHVCVSAACPFKSSSLESPSIEAAAITGQDNGARQHYLAAIIEEASLCQASRETTR